MGIKRVFFGEVTDEQGTLLQYDVCRNLPFHPEYIACITDTHKESVYYNKANLLCDCVIAVVQGSAVLQLDGVREEKTFVLKRRCGGHLRSPHDLAAHRKRLPGRRDPFVWQPRLPEKPLDRGL